MLKLWLRQLMECKVAYVNRRGSHPDMNPLVYGRRSAPSSASDPVVQPCVILDFML